MKIDMIKRAVAKVACSYPLAKVILFGSQADGSATQGSDVDLIVEFSKPVTLLTLSGIKLDLEEILGCNVDIVHGPVRQNDMLEIKQEVLIYAA